MAVELTHTLEAQFGIALPMERLLDGLSLEALVTEALQPLALTAVPPSPIPHLPRGGDAALPLSFDQEQLWLSDRAVPGNAAYNLPLVVRLAGALNLNALEHGLNEIVRRHEVLRTTFPLVRGLPAASITPEWAPALPVIDLSA